MTPVTDSERDAIIKAAIDDFFETDFAEGIDWLGTGSHYPSEEQQRAEVRPVVEAVLAPVLALLAEQAATIEQTASGLDGLLAKVADGWFDGGEFIDAVVDFVATLRSAPARTALGSQRTEGPG